MSNGVTLLALVCGMLGQKRALCISRGQNVKREQHERHQHNLS